MLAKCLKTNLNSPHIRKMQNVSPKPLFTNISIYFDVWCFPNGRFQQRMFDPKQDLLTAEWNFFKKVSWLIPLLSDLSPWRKYLNNLKQEVFKWSNCSVVLFVADFPGLYLENYISSDFSNTSLTVLQKVVVVEQYDKTNNFKTYNVTLYENDSAKIKAAMFHKVYTISIEPFCYMYTYNNHSMGSFSYENKSLFLKHLYILHLYLEVKTFFVQY